MSVVNNNTSHIHACIHISEDEEDDEGLPVMIPHECSN